MQPCVTFVVHCLLQFSERIANTTYAHSYNSDQPGHLHILIKVFPVGIRFQPCLIRVFARHIGHCKGVVAWSVVRPHGMQEAPRSNPTSGTFFLEDLVMKIFLQPFLLFR